MAEKPRRRILNVDDNDAGRYATTRTLIRAGYDVLEAADGRAALRLAEKRPDLVILDVNLPDINGFEVCKRLKADEATASIPVVHLSATYVGSEARVEGLEGGADGYLTQPVDPMELVATVRAFLRIKEAEEALRESEDRYRDLVENSQDLIFTHDLEGNLLSVNPAAVRFSGYSAAELAGMNLREFFAPHIRSQFAVYLAQIKTHSRASGVMLVQTKSGEERRWEYDNTLRTEGVAFPIVRGMARDITARTQAEEALHRAERRYRELFEDAPVMYVITRNCQGAPVIEDCNQLFLNTLGYDRGHVVGRPLADLYSPESRVALLESGGYARALRGEFTFAERELLTREGRIIPVLIHAAPETDATGGVIGTRAAFMDITARKQAEEALRQAQKTESLGVLAGGIAHDFNNLLVAMLGQTSLALAKLPAESAARAAIEKAINAAQRAADLTRQMLAYSGRGQFLVQPLRLNALVQENMRLLEVAVPKHVSLRAELADDLPLIEADAGQMQQVLMNLIINAAEAIGDRAGMVTVATGARTLTPADSHFWLFTGDPLPPGRYVTLAVRDDGCGMNAETRARIFDPFFTTKFTGRGLGLAAVLGIIRGHRGGLHVESTPGAGTTFYLVFPASEAAAATLGAGGPAAPPAPGRTESQILIIDDETMVLEVVGEILEMVGVRVLTAANGAAGVALYREQMTDISLVLLDLSMPGLSGAETFRQLRQVNPQVRVVISSGYDESEVAPRFAGQGLTGFIQKPYGAETLIAAIRRYLA